MAITLLLLASGGMGQSQFLLKAHRCEDAMRRRRSNASPQYNSQHSLGEIFSVGDFPSSFPRLLFAAISIAGSVFAKPDQVPLTTEAEVLASTPSSGNRKICFHSPPINLTA